jgi:hypothetical protein
MIMQHKPLCVNPEVVTLEGAPLRGLPESPRYYLFQELACPHRGSLPQLCSASHELLNLQRLALSRVAHQSNSLLWSMRDAHPAARTGGTIEAGQTVIHRDRCKLVGIPLRTAGRAIYCQFVPHSCAIVRDCPFPFSSINQDRAAPPPESVAWQCPLVA